VYRHSSILSAAMSKGAYGNPNRFLTRREQLEFRTITTLLELTNVLDSASPGESYRRQIQPPNRYFEARRRTADAEAYKLFTHFTNLTIRHHEIVALVAADKNAGGISLIKEPDSHDQENLGDHKPNDKSKIPALEATRRSGGLQPDDDELIGTFFLRTRDYTRKATKELEFEAHCHILVQLLKQNHAATTPVERKKSRQRLAVYVYLSSVDKMLARFLNGMVEKGSNLWQILTTETARLEPGAYNALPELLSNDNATENEKRWIGIVVRFWIRSKLIAQEVADELQNENNPLYDKAGRQRFQEMLYLCTTHAWNSLNDLKKAKIDLSRKWKKENLDKKEITKELERVAMVAINSVRNLVMFRSTFEDKILPHLEWLATISHLRSTIAKKRKTYVFRNSRLPDSSSTVSTSALPSSGAQHASSDAAFPTSDPPGPSHVSPSVPYSENIPLSNIGMSLEDLPISSNDIPLMDLLDQSSETVNQGVSEMSIAQNEDDDDQMELEDLAHQDDGWEAATEKYMQLMCLHHEALRQLSAKRGSDSYEKYISSLIQKVELNTVHVEPENNDQVMCGISTFLKTFQPDGRDLSEQECREIFDWLEDNTKAKGFPNGLETEVFYGTWHCETLLMSLHLLSSVDADSLRLPADAEISANDHHLLLPEKDVVQKFKDIRALLMVTKRCCPACNQLLELVRKQQKKDPSRAVTMYPGFHVTWSSVALPPWLPREYALPVVEHARSALRERLRKLLALILEETIKNSRQRLESLASATSLEWTGQLGLMSEDEDDYDFDIVEELPLKRRKVEQ